MDDNNLPKESFGSILRRAGRLNKKVLITEGGSDQLVYSHHLPAGSENIICRPINTISMSESGHGNRGQITSNANAIGNNVNVAAIIDLDYHVYGGIADDELISFGIFSSCGYAIENYALSETELLKENFYDAFDLNSHRSNWDNAINTSVKCYSFLSNLFYNLARSGSCDYHYVRTIGNNFLQDVIRNDIQIENGVVYLKIMLERRNYNASIISDVFDDPDNFSWKKLDCKLVVPCMKLAFHWCRCSSVNDLPRRIVSFIGRYQLATHLTDAINYLSDSS